MNAALKYLRLKTSADLLAVQFFASSGQLRGRFVQETEPPWNIWWEIAGEQSLIGRLGSMIQGQIDAPETVWESGSPASSLKEMSWLDLFRKAVIRPEKRRQVAEEVVLMTADREVFFATVKNHFMLQQGKIEFAVIESRREYFLLKIAHPSLWVFNTLDHERFIWFNQISGHSGIYIEAGWKISDISGPECYNQFKLMESGILLVQKDGRLINLKPSWKKGESIIRIDCGNVGVPQKDDGEGLVIQPKLRRTDRRQPEMLWKVEDRARLKAIIANESLRSFRQYRCWSCSDGRVFIRAGDDNADRAIASILTDAFASYSEPDGRIFVPTGYLLAPRLSTERLHEIFAAPMSDSLCFEHDNDGLKCVLLRGEDMISIEDLVALEVEGAIDKQKPKNPAGHLSSRN
jgi:hypothetical protein